MPSIKVYNQSGAEAGNLELSEAVFGVDYNEAVIHQVLVAINNNKRQGTKSALTRAEVRGGGKKPFRQKGTGNARQGSTRAPQWIHGGVVFAPKPRDFSQKVNKNVKRLAIKSALSQKLAQNEIMVVDKVELSAAKTKEMVAVLNNLSLDGQKVLFVVDNNETLLRASNNISYVKTINPSIINVLDVVNSGVCLMTVDAIKKIEETYND